MTDDLVTGTGGKRAGIKFVVFAETQTLVVPQRMFVQKGAADHRFQKAGFPAFHAGSGNIAFHELRQRQKPGLWFEAGRLHGRRARNRLLDEGDIVGHQIPVVIFQHGGKTAFEKKVVRIENADERCG
ncbi:hypothetical protein D3C87_1387430 [compost metagenome]